MRVDISVLAFCHDLCFTVSPAGGRGYIALAGLLARGRGNGGPQQWKNWDGILDEAHLLAASKTQRLNMDGESRGGPEPPA